MVVAEYAGMGAPGGHRKRIANVCTAEIENRCRRQYFTHSPCRPSQRLGKHGRACWSRRNDAKKIGVSALWWWWNGRTRGSQNALQSCAPQKLKIDAGANTSLTRRANPPEDSGSSSERAGASSNAAQSNAARAPECIVAHTL